MGKAAIPQGTRDFWGITVQKRNYILNTIRSIFELYGFSALETPAMENLHTLMGKYGEEGDKLIFKILNNGLNDPKNLDKANSGFKKVLEGKNTTELTERALRYDLTIPFARFIAMNHGQLSFPFKRYQIQQVWRADRPQRGRYREFTQCDADVVGSKSLINEVELARIYHRAFSALRLPNYTLMINSRKLLAALAEVCGGIEKLTDITTAIDKLDKIGIEKVNDELNNKGLDSEQIGIINSYLSISGKNEDILNSLSGLFNENENAKNGIADLKFIMERTGDVNLQISPSLARGLNYYTGTIFEVKAPAEINMGSIGGGGRYDDLTGLFGVSGIAGVGISFGVDRIYDVLEELDLFPVNLNTSTEVLFFNLGGNEAAKSFELVEEFRNAGIAAELYHENTKLDKQFKYAEKKQIPVVIIIGEKELETATANIKVLASGQQKNLPWDQLISFFRA